MKGRVTTITFQGKTMTLKEWAADLGVSSAVLQSRLARGWPLEKVLVPRLRKRYEPITFNGMSLTVKEWSRKLGIPEVTLRSRLAKKLPLDKVFFQGKMKPGVSHFLTHDGLTLNLTDHQGAAWGGRIRGPDSGNPTVPGTRRLARGRRCGPG
jgi:hypothetical protein